MQSKRKILIAPDSFKGSISAEDAAAAIAHGLSQNAALTDPELICVPIADGGEGTLSALVPAERQITVAVHGTNGQPVDAAYGYIEKTAIIEMARAAGLTLVAEKDRFVPYATTVGVGELIRDALDRGFRDILLTVGGSGTNDGGCGMLAALGADFVTDDGVSFTPAGATLKQIAYIDTEKLDPRLKECRFTIATDVKNPLLGPEGATYVYAKQKGCHDSWLPEMEKGMSHYATVLEKTCGLNVAATPGCGAGGGISAPLLAFCNATIRSGIDAVLEAVRFDALLQGADAVITGEGKIDRQSLYGKAISGVANAAKKANVPVFCLVGCIGDDKNELLKMGLADILAIGDIAPDAAYSMTHADELLEKLATTMSL
ncbi:MAG: glycerate kinase [Ruminococcaceae bacterium]|nr:glycerate kinase [Oscillospiraceae bacterium]